MKIKPIVLCGGSGSRLNLDKNRNLPKQFIDFGGWTLFEKTLDRIKSSIFDTPIISTNKKYLKLVKFYLKLKKINNYKIVLEPLKKNTAAAILSSTLIEDIPSTQPLVFFSSDHLIEKKSILEKSLKNNKINLDSQNLFIFGIKPTSPSSEYGYFLTQKNKHNINKVSRFIEKPNVNKAKQIIKKKGYWNSGMFFIRKDSIINNFKKYQPSIYKHCLKSIKNSINKSNIIYLNRFHFSKIKSSSFDYAILEKVDKIFAIKLNIHWSDLGSWKEILKMYDKNKTKYIKKKNIFYRPWGKYTNIFKGKNFLIKELYIKPKGVLSLQKHNYRAEHWLITQGNPKIILNKEIFKSKPNDHIFIPVKAIHRIINDGKKPVKISEAQIGTIIKESDIERIQDKYNRI